MQQLFSQHKPIVLRLNQLAPEAPELQDRLDAVNRDWSRARSFLQQRDASLRKTLTNCQVRNHKNQIIKVPGKKKLLLICFPLLALLVWVMPVFLEL